MLFPITGIRDVDAAAVVTLELVARAATCAHWAERQTWRPVAANLEKTSFHLASLARISPKGGPKDYGGHFSERITFCLVFWRQHSDGDVIRALLAPAVGHSQLEGVNTLLETADLQQPRMSRLLHTNKSQ